MNSKILIALLLISVVLLAGCTSEQKQESSIKSQEQVQQVVTNVTDNIGDIQDTLTEIDQTFD